MMNKQNDSIKKAIDQIEPAQDAKARMLANIRRKAAEQNAQTATAEKAKKAKVLSFNRVMQWALPIAACFVVVLAGLFLANRNLFGTQDLVLKNNSSDYSAEDSDQEYPQEAANDRPSDTPINNNDHQQTGLENDPNHSSDTPIGGNEEGQTTLDGQTGHPIFEGIDTTTTIPRDPMPMLEAYLNAGSFTRNGHVYSLQASIEDPVANDLEWIANSTPVDENAISGEKTGGDVVQLSIVWRDGNNYYILSNADGAPNEEIVSVYESLID